MNRGISWPALWLGIIGFGILYVPVTVMVIYSFNSSRLVSVWAGFSTKWYGELLENDAVLEALGKSLWVAVNAATLSTVFGVLIALAFVRLGNFRFRLLLSALASMPLVMLPFWTSSLLRIYALIGLLNTNGFINSMLLQLGLIQAPIRMMQTDFSIYMGMLLTYLPLMILPLYAVMIRLDDDLLDAAADLGASRVEVFRTIVLPLTVPGIIAGSLLVFIPAVGEFVIPALLGGPEQVMIGKVLWTEFFRNRDWPVASAIAMLLLAILALPIIYARYQDGRETALDRAEDAGRGGVA